MQCYVLRNRDSRRRSLYLLIGRSDVLKIIMVTIKEYILHCKVDSLNIPLMLKCRKMALVEKLMEI